MSNVIDDVSALLICGHGSRSPEATTEFNDLLIKLQYTLSSQQVRGAFLEFNQPTIAEALEELYDQGHRHIKVQPLTLYNAGHTLEDIPAILAQFQEKYPDVALRYGPSLGLINPIIEAATAAILSAMPAGTDPEDCKLLVVGRGSRDRAVADQTVNLCRKLHQRIGFGDSAYCYSFESAPLLPNALQQAAQSHYMQVIVLPYLLFSGRLLTDIHREIDTVADQYPNFTFHKAPHLGLQEAMVTALIDHLNNY